MARPRPSTPPHKSAYIHSFELWNVSEQLASSKHQVSPVSKESPCVFSIFSNSWGEKHAILGIFVFQTAISQLNPSLILKSDTPQTLKIGLLVQYLFFT
ncbi:MAG TPA: hypothetical protein DCS30_18240 [Rhizobiales bacterium]|nr:hypothetical protein [Hyphomicrobiales bacterium]